MSIPKSARLFLDSARGRYIPRDFFALVKPECVNWNCSDDTKEWILTQTADPDNEFYWDAWNEVETQELLTVIDPANNVEHYILHDEDLWLVPCITPDGETCGAC